MANVEVQADFGKRVEQFTELAGGIKGAGKIFDHDAHAAITPSLNQFAKAQQIARDNKAALVHRRVTVGMDVHPFDAEMTESIKAALQLLDRGAANRLEG